MAQQKTGSRRSEPAFDPDADVAAEEPYLNGGRPKSRSSKKNASIVMLDLSQSRLALYFLAAQASILVILLALILYFSSVLSNIRTLSQGVSENLQMCKNVLDSAQKTFQEATRRGYSVPRYRPAPAPVIEETPALLEDEPPKSRRPKPS